MQEFNEQGTRKLKDTVEKELGNILDRLESLTSDQCSYDTFSGKAKDMEGNVKFVIETDAIKSDEQHTLIRASLSRYWIFITQKP